MAQPQVTFEIKAKVRRGGYVLAEFDSEASAETWIAQRRLEGRVELIVKEDGKWVKR
jgi:hypothetical protein